MLDKRTRDLLLASRDSARKAGVNAEYLLHREKSSLVRLGNSSVALSTYEELTRLDVQVQDGRKVGSYGLCADITTQDQLDDALARAKENCRAALPKDYEPIFGVVEEAVDDATGFDPALEHLSPEDKAALCATVIKTIKPGGKYDFSGSWSSGSTEMYCLTTANDKEAWRKLTDGRFVMVLKEQDKKWELSVEKSQKRAGEFTAEQVITELKEMLPVYEKNPGYRTTVGRQKVMFGPQAVSELLTLALWGGFYGRSWEEKRSYTAQNKLGERIFPEAITMKDDPTNPNVFGMPFDFKGMRRRPFILVDKGVFTNLVYDSGTAAKYGKKPTGHDLGTGDLCLGTGDAPAGIAAGRKLAADALYIPHLHYIHMPDPTKGMFTGSSRFNARLIKGGEFVAPLVSSRVTDTIPQVLGQVIALSSKSMPFNISATYGRRNPEAMSVPEYIICNDVRISDVADSF
jgi:PmbA protein